MSVKHLTDAEMQALADGTTSPEHEAHLLVCEKCRRELAAYQVLEASFGEAPADVFSTTFEAQIIGQLRKTAQPRFRFQGDFWLGFFIALGCVTIFGYFLTSSPSAKILWQPFELLREVINLKITGMAALVILLYGLGDRLVGFLKSRTLISQNGF